jgi:hypothetical protein
MIGKMLEIDITSATRARIDLPKSPRSFT